MEKTRGGGEEKRRQPTLDNPTPSRMSEGLMRESSKLNTMKPSTVMRAMKGWV